uniref:CARD- and ANK-containing Inflammasome Adaptor Protein n=1 Tax=Gouania willdenowi TaxID=441366 RepID=A0A8C5D616_GOUWI
SNKWRHVDLQNNTGCTALHRAASRGHTDIVKALIQAGAPIHVVDDQGRTPVHLAAEQLQLESVSVLVKEEASQPESLRKNTFLHMAGREDNWKLMELLVLVAENADLDVRLSDFSSALHLGVQSGNTSIVRALLEKGMDPDIKTVKGFTPLHVAAHYDRAEIGKAATEVKDRQGRTALHLAAHSGGKSSLIDLLLSANSNVNVSDNEKKTALHLAAMDGDKHVVASLLSHKAKVLVRDMDGSTPLHYAAAGGHASIVSILLRSVNNRGLEDRNAWRKTSLHVAAEKGHDGVVVVLLETGAKVNATDQSKDTPLHCAARGGHPSVVERLLNWGQTGPKGQQNMVNLQMTNKVGKTALQVAESENSPQHENISIILKKRMLLIK